MKTIKIISITCLMSVMANEQSLQQDPLPGLKQKAHLKHLKRSDINLDLVHTYDNEYQIINEEDNGSKFRDQKENWKKEAFEEAYHNSPLYKGRTTPATDSINNLHNTLSSHIHPKVQQSYAYCSRSVDRLKKGPVDISEKICKNEQYVDESFKGTEQIWWDDYNSVSSYNLYKTKLDTGTYYFDDWTSVYPDGTIFTNNGSVAFNHVIQGGAGTVYLISALGSVGEFPHLVKNLFITQTTNQAKVLGVKFYIRGKPWAVTIDEKMLFMYPQTPLLKFTQPSPDRKNFWASVLEKAWAKVKGNYLISQGGLVANGLRALTGIPVFMYNTYDIKTYTQADTLYETILAADSANYLMGAGTSGNGDNTEYNSCGIAMSHAYSILAAFTMTDSDGSQHKMFLMRNPWGLTNYKKDWHKSDTRWTDALVAQVPFGIDPRTQAISDGLFVVPNYLFIGEICFDNYQIGHQRDSEGFVDTWYDHENDDEQTREYAFTVDSTQSDIYFTVETYSHSIIPVECTQGTYSGGSRVSYPVAFFEVWKGGLRKAFRFYLDQTHRPILMPSSNHADGDQYSIQVKYEWIGSPAKDYTVKVYSKYTNLQITDTSGNSNKINMDGQQPSGFTESKFIGMTDDCQRYLNNDVTVEIKDIKVKSLLDVFQNSNNAVQVFEFIYYNPWVLVVWFHFW